MDGLRRETVFVALRDRDDAVLIRDQPSKLGFPHINWTHQGPAAFRLRTCAPLIN
ncbi:hypothetical protein GCM10009648_05750 [Tsukamurella spumae]